MLTFKFSGVDGAMIQSDRLTSGMVGKEVRIELSADWDDLTKTAVFTAGGVTRDVVGVGDTVVIPAEVLAKPYERLCVGIYGVGEDGALVIPTIMASGPTIMAGADPSGDEGAAPDLAVWAQILSMIGDLTGLNTTAKETLVAAINESLTKGGSKEEIRQMVDDYLTAHPPAVKETDPTVPAWAKQPTKPSYTAAEVGALPADTEIPEQVQANFSQNDSTAADYVKNRTHYENVLSEYLVFEGELALGGTATANIDYHIPAGTIVEQYLNGSLLCTVTAFTSGDKLIASDGRIQVDFEGNTVTVGNYFNSGTIKIVARDVCTERKQLDEKFIPSTIARSESIPTDDYINSLIDAKLALIPNTAEVAY